MTETVIFIDGSYFCFYRYYSIIRWWKSAHPEEPLIAPFENPIFLEKFKKTFIENVKSIPKKLGVGNPTIIVGKDCKRETIWRNALIEKYKGNRDNKNVEFEGGPFFKMMYDEELFIQGGACKIISYPTLEADDCIAIYIKQLLLQRPNVEIYIIASDKDYLQLLEPRVKIYNLAFKNILDQKSAIGDAKTELFCKILMGDQSDNIPSVLKKCGPKTALKCYHDKAYFDERMKAENAYDKWERNKKLVDFNCIPENLVSGFLKENHVLQENHVLGDEDKIIL